MKSTFLLFVLCMYCFAAKAQWSNKNNLFADSLSMPVCTYTSDQEYPVVVRSYPDKGYFVMWLDKRNDGVYNYDLYGQKFDSAGKALWTADGKAIATGDRNQWYSIVNGVDYRYYSYACTDSANGFYLVWEDQSGSTGSIIKVQHLRSDGSKIFSKPVVLATSNSSISYSFPQLIADGNKGFFVSYLKKDNYGLSDVYVFCYRDENGTLKYYGGGQMNYNGVNNPTQKLCGQGNDIIYREAAVSNYQIYPDNQKGCNVVMTMDTHEPGNEGQVTGFNRLCRVKKTCTASQYVRSDLANENLVSIKYKKDSVVRLYSFTSYSQGVSCTAENGNIYVYTDYYVENFGNGFIYISNLSYSSTQALGVTISSGNNININVIAACERRYLNNTVGNYYVNAYFRQQEVYDSLPYQLCSSNQHYVAYNTIIPTKYAYLKTFTDTAFSTQSPYPYSFHITGSSTNVLLAGTSSYSYENPLLQQFKVVNTSGNNYAVQYATSNQKGVMIGKDVYTGFGGTQMLFEDEFVAGDNSGNFFYAVDEYGHTTHVSPVGTNVALKWGAMGRPLNRISYTVSPYVVIDPTDGTGVVAWFNNSGPNGTGNNVFIRHLDNLKDNTQPPPLKAVRVKNFATYNNPAVMLGTSNAFSMVNGFDLNNNYTPIFELTDKFNLGAVQSTVYEHPSNYSIRTYNGTPYLGRNFAIIPENNSTVNLDVRLYITKEEMDVLKAADATITSPSQLVAIQQPNAGGSNAPDTYAPVTGQQTLTQINYSSTPGGYYLVYRTKNLGNFFLFKQGTLFNNNSLAAKTFNTDGFIKSVFPTILSGSSISIQTGNKNVKDMTVELYNANGQLIFKKENVNYASQQIPVELKLPGSYQLYISSGANIFSTKIIKP